MTEYSLRRTRRCLAAVAAVFALGLLAGCAADATDAEAGEDDAVSTASERSATPLEQDAEKVRQALDGKTDADNMSAGRLRSVLSKAGWPRNAVEVGQNVTPTGLDVDNVDAGIRTQHGCVLADIRSDGTVTVTTTQPTHDGRCLVGHVYDE